MDYSSEENICVYKYFFRPINLNQQARLSFGFASIFDSNLRLGFASIILIWLLITGFLFDLYLSLLNIIFRLVFWTNIILGLVFWTITSAN